MIAQVGRKYQIEIETISKAKAEYQTDEYFELDLPAAPAVMVGDEIVVEGSDIPEDKLEGVICKHLGFPVLSQKRRGSSAVSLPVKFRGG